jgi:hypothetical protein
LLEQRTAGRPSRFHHIVAISILALGTPAVAQECAPYAERVELCAAVVSGAPKCARSIRVVQVENFCDEMPADRFWGRVELLSKTATAGRRRDFWGVPLFREYFFGALREDRHERNSGSAAAYDALPHLRGRLGSVVDYAPAAAGAPQPARLAVADDLPFHPVMGPHPFTIGRFPGIGGVGAIPGGTVVAPDVSDREVRLLSDPTMRPYSDRYYPRRNAAVADKYLSSYRLTGDPHAFVRSLELLDYVLFSQYDAAPNGGTSNGLVNAFYPAALAAWPLIQAQQGTFDCDYDFEWIDGTGYRWRMHEGDHHVNADQAATLIKGFEATGDRRYLDAAISFVEKQVPRYGFHTGLYDERRYYWTEYNPSGSGLPVDDAVINVAALVAKTCAMAGYHSGNHAMLEYSRGLLWYIVRQFDLDDRRLYYFGAESHQSSASSGLPYEMSAFAAAMQALPYLYGAGVDLSRELPAFEAMYARYLYDERGLAAADKALIPFYDRRLGRVWWLTSRGSPATSSAFVQLTGPAVRIALQFPVRIDARNAGVTIHAMTTDGVSWHESARSVIPLADTLELTPFFTSANTVLRIDNLPDVASSAEITLVTCAAVEQCESHPENVTVIGARAAAVTTSSFSDIAARLWFPSDPPVRRRTVSADGRR